MQHILLTGGTGFFGKSILDYRLRDSYFASNYEFTILSRDPDSFIAAYPQLANQSGITFIQGDIRSFNDKATPGKYGAIIHAATSTLTTINDDEQTSVILDGTRHVIDFAKRAGISRILFTSSGAVYGPQSAPVSENAPTRPTTAYGEGKLEAERLLIASGLDVKIARCFAFTGPHLNRRIHFAIGNFIQNCLEDKPIVIKGDGTPLRSYLYADDLVEWLFAILEHGVSGRPYNVGSNIAISIHELAQTVRRTLNTNNPIVVKSPPTGMATSTYVPIINRAHMELGLNVTIQLENAIRQSLNPSSDKHLDNPTL